MSRYFPEIVCLVGAVIFFGFAMKLLRFKVPAIPPVSRAHLSTTERQRKIKMAAWLSFAVGCLMLGGSAGLFWMERSN